MVSSDKHVQWDVAIPIFEERPVPDNSLDCRFRCIHSSTPAMWKCRAPTLYAHIAPALVRDVRETMFEDHCSTGHFHHCPIIHWRHVFIRCLQLASDLVAIFLLKPRFWPQNFPVFNHRSVLSMLPP